MLLSKMTDSVIFLERNLSQKVSVGDCGYFDWSCSSQLWNIGQCLSKYCINTLLLILPSGGTFNCIQLHRYESCKMHPCYSVPENEVIVFLCDIYGRRQRVLSLFVYQATISIVIKGIVSKPGADVATRNPRLIYQGGPEARREVILILFYGCVVSLRFNRFNFAVSVNGATPTSSH